jgi:ParB family chromosome partitioning protein
MNHKNMKLPEGKTRLDLVREGLAQNDGLKKRGRLIVSVHRLNEDPKNERKTFRNMDGLIASIRAVGLIEPITVTPESDDAYRIITGHRRYRAAKAAGLQQVEVLIRDPEDELVRRQKSVVSNVQREDVGPVELAEGLQSLMDEHPKIKSQDDLAKLIGKDKTWVSRMLRILDLPAPLQAKVATSQLSLSYDAVASVARMTDRGDQERLIDALLSGASTRDIRQQIATTTGKGKAGVQKEPSTPKPKRVYRTAHRATVIVQATSKHLSNQQCVDALREAMEQASG